MVKARVIITMLFAGLTLTPISSAHAIFGLGKCERVEKSIKAEEEIGRESWNFYREQVRKYNKSAANNDYLAEAILEVFYSDKTVWNLAISNPKCFNPAQNAEVRRQLSYTKKQISYYKAFIRSSNSQTYSYDWTNYYPRYSSAVEILRGLAKKS